MEASQDLSVGLYPTSPTYILYAPVNVFSPPPNLSPLLLPSPHHPQPQLTSPPAGSVLSSANMCISQVQGDPNSQIYSPDDPRYTDMLHSGEFYGGEEDPLYPSQEDPLYPSQENPLYTSQENPYLLQETSYPPQDAPYPSVIMAPADAHGPSAHLEPHRPLNPDQKEFVPTTAKCGKVMNEFSTLNPVPVEFKPATPSLPLNDKPATAAVPVSLNPNPQEFVPKSCATAAQEFVPKSRAAAVKEFVPKSRLAAEINRLEPKTTKSAADQPNLVVLRGSAGWQAPGDWAQAPEFVPKVEETKPKSWAQVVNTNNPNNQHQSTLSVSECESQLCPFFKVGECRYGVMCIYIHGDRCDYCAQNCLHPNHQQQRSNHLSECLREHERDMELSFAVARSREKTCGICMETVLDKPHGEARFGILPSCSHCFCLPCIRKWRQAKQFEHKIIRACPECRQTSDFICPSRFWVDTQEEKDKLLNDYKKNLGLKECKYFNKGVGECPFGNKCFYRHADKDGRSIDVGPPKKPVRRSNAEGNLSLVQRLLLYDFLEERDGQLVFPLDFVELFDLYSDEDDWSDGEA